MDVQLQELIDKIKKDGVAAAEKESAKIIAASEKKAETIIADAEAKAEQIPNKMPFAGCATCCPQKQQHDKITYRL